MTAKPGRDVVQLAQQLITRDWWERRRHLYRLYTSQAVIDEASDGDPDAAQRRLDALRDIPLVAPMQEARALAEEMIDHGLLPSKAAYDAAHLALATANKVDVLLTWNCKHLANVDLLVGVYRFLRSGGYEPPTVCTPAELMGNVGGWQE